MKPFRWQWMGVFCVGLLVSVGCGTPEVKGPACTTKVCTSTISGELKRTIVDATEKEKWVYFSFQSGALVEVSDPTSSSSWDLGFQRSNIKTNSGISGSGGVKVAILEMATETDFTGLSKAPAEGFTEDQNDQNADDVPEYAFSQKEGWYNYDLGTHLLSPKARMYVVLGTDKKYYKLKIHSYYNAEAKAAFPSFDWVALPAP